mmetsp:Transcript_9536/g.22956  ORF Transcript_9536/g.22956 Transcript_9536/m.22956 type:complete len:88 (-) Transcript_9536:570-833(-)
MSARPKELDLDDKWEQCIDTFLRRAVYGSLAGGLGGLILLRVSLNNSLCFDSRKSCTCIHLLGTLKFLLFFAPLWGGHLFCDICIVW